MFERFTGQARQVVVSAQEEARALGHRYIGTEHILLGLLREPDGIAARLLAEWSLSVEDVRGRIERSAVPRDAVAGEPIPFTPLAKKVLELALREALALGHNYIGSEHVLLGLVEVTDGSGAQILLELGLDPATVRPRVIGTLPPGSSRGTRTTATSSQFRSVTSPLVTPDVRAFLAEIEREIREQLGREPDLADFWLALASIPGSLIEHVLDELGTDAAAFAGAVERARGRGAAPLGGLTPDQATRHARPLFGLSSPD